LSVANNGQAQAQLLEQTNMCCSGSEIGLPTEHRVQRLNALGWWCESDRV